MSVTLKDIAKMANVSVASVSLVLNNRKNRISIAKQEEILRIAKEFGYQVNLTARSLVTNKSGTLGLILPDLENLFFSSFAQKLELIARSSGYALFIMCNNENKEDDLWLIDQLVSRGVEGLFICPSNSSLDFEELINKLDNLTIPFVMVDRAIADKPYNKVSFDNEWGSYMAVEYLIKHGHKKIGCIAPPNSRVNGNLRLNGYLKALKDYRLPVDNNLIVEGDYKFLSGYNAAEKLLKNKLTAIFSCNDMMTLGLMKYINEKGLKVPDDLSIVSYDNVIDYFFLEVGITSIEQDIDLLAKSSLEVMLNTISQKDKTTFQEVYHKPKFLKKQSVKKI